MDFFEEAGRQGGGEAGRHGEWESDKRKVENEKRRVNVTTND